jgi:DNA-binding CsgD family transcriptional regulator
MIQTSRATSCPDFSSDERRRLQEISPLVFSILERHLSAKQADAKLQALADNKINTIEQRFHERLRLHGLRLSEREMQVCLGLLAGRTVQEQARHLMLKVNTVGSYQRRAAAKLNIKGRSSLVRWVYGD